MIAVIGALDTKADEYQFLVQEVLARGHEVAVIDFGPFSKADAQVSSPGVRYVGPAEVAAAAGVQLDALRSGGNRSLALEAMAVGVGKVLLDLGDQLDGVIGAGGSGTTVVVTRAMRTVNFRCPLVIVSTVASVDIGRYIEGLACTVMNPVVDVSGLNSITRPLLESAASAVCAMAGHVVDLTVGRQERVGISMFGITTPGVDHARRVLEGAGLEVFVFHANNRGGSSLEMLVREGVITAVLDMTTTEMADAVVGGCLPAAAHRFRTCGSLGLPQVVSLGALDVVNFESMDTVPVDFQDRRLLAHTPEVTLMRTTESECSLIGEELMRRLNESTSEVTVFLPHGGLSTLSVPQGPFYDPEADQALIESVVAAASPAVRLVHMDGSINDPQVAEGMATCLLQQLERTSTNTKLEENR